MAVVSQTREKLKFSLSCTATVRLVPRPFDTFESELSWSRKTSPVYDFRSQSRTAMPVMHTDVLLDRHP
jgi:hypothetical protein